MKNPYRKKTTKQLVEAYAAEAKKEQSQHDRKTKQNMIISELDRRIEEFINSLDDEETMENPEGTYRILSGE